MAKGGDPSGGRALSEDGKELTITRDLKTPQGDFTQKLVLTKES